MDNPAKNYVYLKSNQGFGCILSKIESAFMFCKDHKISHLLIDLRESTYLDDPSVNAFEFFFKPIRSKFPKIITDTARIDKMLKSTSGAIEFFDGDNLWKKNEKGRKKALSQISKGKALSKRFVLNDYVIENVDRYRNIFFQPDKYIIGVHARFGNKEKSWPQGRLTKKDKYTIFNKLDVYLGSLTKLQKRVGIFVCSDTESFVDEIKDKYDNVIHISRFFLGDGAGASISEEHLNVSKKNDSIGKISKYGRIKIGVEALTDIFLLKECDIILRTPSSFSELALNNGVPCIDINKP